MRVGRAILDRARRESWAWIALERGQLVAVAGRLSLFTPDVREHCDLIRIMPDSDAGYEVWRVLDGGRA